MEAAGTGLSPILHILSLLTRPEVLGLVLLGNLIGLLFGVLPGVSGGQAFVIVLPLTLPPNSSVSISRRSGR